MPLLRFLALLLFLSLVVTNAPTQTDVQGWIKAGDQAVREKRYQDAYKSYEKANKSSGEKCPRCLLRMAFTKLYLHEDGSALKLADRSLALAVDPIERADAYSVKGDILLAIGGSDTKKLAAAEEAYKSARKEDPNAEIFQFRLGKILLCENKIDEGRSELESFLKRRPGGPESVIARRWLEHPTKVQFPIAPDFEVKTIDGQSISSKTLTGRVVVIDFWATWCPPCRASVPELKDLTQKYSADKLVFISVSSDSDQEGWKKFVAAKQMTWPQSIDTDHHMTKLFDVNAFPTYIIIDGDGFVRERLVSFDPRESLAHRLKDPLKKMLE